MNKQTVYDDRFMNMLRIAMKAYSDIIALKNDSPDTVKNYRSHFGNPSLRTPMIYTYQQGAFEQNKSVA